VEGLRKVKAEKNCLGLGEEEIFKVKKFWRGVKKKGAERQRKAGIDQLKKGF